MADLQSFKRTVEDVKFLFSVDTLKQEQEEDLFNFVSKGLIPRALFLGEMRNISPVSFEL
jgi:hypothetical protein